MPLPDVDTIKGLGLAEPLPLTKLFMFNTTIDAIQADSTGGTYQLLQFTMPFLGDVVLQGAFNIKTNTAGVQAPDAIRISPSSTPAPTINPYSTWRTTGASVSGQIQVPLLAYWGAVTRNTLITVHGHVGNGSGGIPITVVKATGWVMCCKTGMTGITFP